jgi:N-methylhydantoinase B
MPTSSIDGIELSLFQSRVQAVCDEMGVVLRRAAFSPNIKDRLDYSCAVFDSHGGLFGQAAHIPVHLGSMAYAMADIVRQFDWQADDLVLLNDPYLGGTHLPDVTAINPVFHAGRHAARPAARLVGFVACRAHHADIGADQPGSMPVSTSLADEGVVISPLLMRRGGELTDAAKRLFDRLSPVRHGGAESYDADARLGDFFAQFSANHIGARRLGALCDQLTRHGFDARVDALNAYAERLARAALAVIPAGKYEFSDVMDGDGFDQEDVAIRVSISVGDEAVEVDFSTTDSQVPGNINCPLPVTAAAVFYVFRCLMPEHTPACAGAFAPIRMITRRGTLVDARPGAAVAAGNVETSMRIVDVLLGALAQGLPGLIPAASQGTMNNVAMGSRAAGARWDYYETLAGGSGAYAGGAGADVVHTHMTNTLNTPVESLETHYPLRVLRYAIRRGSGGSGIHRGGDGLIREFEFLEPTEVTLLTERRRQGPWGLAGGASGAPGRNLLDDRELPGKIHFHAAAGSRLRIETPGGGGYGSAD